MMFNSPLQYCKVIEEYVALDQTQRQCALEHNCGVGPWCPLEAWFQRDDIRDKQGVQQSSEASREGTVPCAMCLKEVPLSAAKSGEAVDYLLHFCGLECFEQWKARGRATRKAC